MKLRLSLLLIPFVAVADDSSYREMLLSDRPAAYWRFDVIQECCTPNETHQSLSANAGDRASLLEAGPRPPAFPAFIAENTAADFSLYPRDVYLRIKDPGVRSEFDFTNGDTITIEAWVQCPELAEGQNVHIACKGRTGSPSFARDNQNWALRLRGQGGVACISFIFRDGKGSGESAWHRWTATSGFTSGDEWNHVAVSYTFGQPESVRGYVNGESVAGQWDLGGASTKAPVEDNDEVWIGGAMGGAARAQFPGRIDELAIYRRALPQDRIQAHAAREEAMPELKDVPSERIAPRGEALPMPPAIVRADELPPGKVRVQVFENLKPQKPDAQSEKWREADEEPWEVLPSEKTDEFCQPFFALSGLPERNHAREVHAKNSRSLLIRAAGMVRFPAGEYTLLLRAFSGARVAVDGQIVADTSLKPLRYHGKPSGAPPAKSQFVSSLPAIPPGSSESKGRFSSDGQPHVLVVECLIGSEVANADIGELFVAVAKEAASFSLLSPAGGSAGQPILTPASWMDIVAGQRARIETINKQRQGGNR